MIFERRVLVFASGWLLSISTRSSPYIRTERNVSQSVKGCQIACKLLRFIAHIRPRLWTYL